MVPFVDCVPEARLVERLYWQLRYRVSGASFVAAGDALAMGVLGSRGDPAMPTWVGDLADVMAGALLRVQDATMDDAPPDERVRLARAAAVLSVVRPRMAAACDAAISVWMGWDMPLPAEQHTPSVVASRVLLALMVEDADLAVRCVSRLLELEPEGIGGVLEDWVSVRVAGRGAGREIRCFQHLRVALSRARRSDPALMLLAALTLHTRRVGLNRQDLLIWLDRMAVSLRGDGSARLSA